MYRIFLVEDDPALAQELKNQLERREYEVRTVSDFRAVPEEVRAFDPHLVLMDIMLPFQNGYHWTAEIRKFSTVPVVFLSSASDDMNIVMAISMGGDDFIPKPVEPMVLCAKVQAVLRRSYEMNANTLEFCGAVLNVNNGSVSAGGQTLELTKNEFRILRTLLENRGRIVSRDALMLRLWNDDCYVEENTLTVNVTRLRRKLEGLGLRDVIVTKPGSGYIIP
ncbi:MAG: response regulator transcription factor [Oscillospiraceae bacterium]|nr:response regulator transcription factor [Oscillospiraceae bacterium]